MKSIITALSLFAILSLSSCSTTQSASSGLVTESIKVSGVCGMCKRRIETAVYGVSGVKTAEWNAQKQALVVIYDAQKASNEAIQKRIAASGHDTEKMKADDRAYGNLPGCCKYRDGVEVHEN